MNHDDHESRIVKALIAAAGGRIRMTREQWEEARTTDLVACQAVEQFEQDMFYNKTWKTIVFSLQKPGESDLDTQRVDMSLRRGRLV